MIKKLIILALILPLFTTGAGAQTFNLDSAKNELYKINKVFDSSRYLGFDIAIKYTSDTAFGNYEYEEMSGRYILNDRNIYYKMGNMEYIQNDSFSFTIYHDDKMMMMGRDSISAKSNLFPVREFTDSVLTWYAQVYNIAVRYEDDSKVLEFTTTDTLAPYRRFTIYYSAESYYPDKFEIYFIEAGAGSSSGGAATDILPPSKKLITVSFSNYNSPDSLNIFDNNNYVSFDRVRGKYQPAEKFRLYRFFTNDANGNGEDDDEELYPPPSGGQ